ncbi:MAG: hypothetical protein LBM95_07780 [Lactobacillales bacterium]|jgi:hypothetical protein|nr:hypothetical protein [Lactobacillales bacterium]
MNQQKNADISRKQAYFFIFIYYMLPKLQLVKYEFSFDLFGIVFSVVTGTLLVLAILKYQYHKFQRLNFKDLLIGAYLLYFIGSVFLPIFPEIL